jgi:hypothetical protein
MCDREWGSLFVCPIRNTPTRHGSPFIVLVLVIRCQSAIPIHLCTFLNCREPHMEKRAKQCTFRRLRCDHRVAREGKECVLKGGRSS